MDTQVVFQFIVIRNYAHIYQHLHILHWLHGKRFSLSTPSSEGLYSFVTYGGFPILILETTL